MAHALLNKQGMAILSHRFHVCVLLSIIALGACNKSNPAAPSAPATTASTSYVFLTGTAPMSGASSQFTATAVGPDGVQTNVTSQATWNSSNQSVVAVTPGGMVRGVTVGSADLSATYNGVTGSTPLIVSAMTCAFSLDPTAASIPGSGGSITISVNVQGPTCQWSAQTSGFLRIEGSASGIGSGSIVVAADPNTGGSRVGTISVAGAAATISQGRTNCVITVSPQTQNVTELGGTFFVNVTAPGGCDWTVNTSATFVSIVGPQSRSGTAQMSYQVAPNQGTSSRSATIRIDQFELTVTQAGTPGHGGDR